MKILALETATDACSAALLIDGILRARFERAPRQHTRLILPMIESVLDEAGLKLNELDAIGFGCGPGAFTGLRIAAGVTQGLAMAADLPVIPVSTLAAIALNAHEMVKSDRQETTRVLAALDARISEIYRGCYEVSGADAVLLGEEQVLLPRNLAVPVGVDWIGAGSGWQACDSIMREALQLPKIRTFPDLSPSAEHIAKLAANAWRRGELLDAAEARPVYLRNKVADTVREREMKNA